MYIRVKVSTQSKKESIEKTNEDHFKISVKEKAERNLANNKVLELLSKYFKIQKNKIRIVNGHRSPTKLLIIEK